MIPALATPTEADILYADIIAHPEDDTPRLVYADWLEDHHGDLDRAEFIRTQVELSRPCVFNNQPWPNSPPARCSLPAGCWKCRHYDELVAREHALSRTLSVTYGPYGGLATAAGEWWTSRDVGHSCERGFVGAVRLPQAAWLEHGPAIVRSQPVTRVELSDRHPYTSPGQLGDRLWVRAAPGRGDRPDILDGRLFDRLKQGQLARMAPGYLWYSAGEDPVADLSNACLAYAKETPTP